MKCLLGLSQIRSVRKNDTQTPSSQHAFQKPAPQPRNSGGVSSCHGRRFRSQGCPTLSSRLEWGFKEPLSCRAPSAPDFQRNRNSDQFVELLILERVCGWATKYTKKRFRVFRGLKNNRVIVYCLASWMGATSSMIHMPRPLVAITRRLSRGWTWRSQTGAFGSPDPR